MKKKIIALSVAAVLLVMAVIGGTYAYLKDEDSAKNVMVVGDVDIIQNENERTENGFGEFTQSQNLVPGTYSKVEADLVLPLADLTDAVDGATAYMWDPAATTPTYNAIDKIVTVTNDGHNDVYYRTIVAVEWEADNTDNDDVRWINWNEHGVGAKGNMKMDVLAEKITIDGVMYEVLVFTNNDILESGKTSVPSLLQVMLDKTAENDDIDGFGGTLDVLALSQAVQSDGFSSAKDALNEAFGEVTAANAAAWLAPVAAEVVE